MEYKNMTMDERVDWASGYILKGLIAGNFWRSVWMVMDMAHRHPFDVSAKKPGKTK